jgi:hypothetical protein
MGMPECGAWFVAMQQNVELAECLINSGFGDCLFHHRNNGLEISGKILPSAAQHPAALFTKPD